MLRLSCYNNSKVPVLNGWTRGVLEDRNISDILRDSRGLNYSIRTGLLRFQFNRSRYRLKDFNV